MNWVKDWYARNTTPIRRKAAYTTLSKERTSFFGLSAPAVIDETDLKNMALTPSYLRWRTLFPRSCRKTQPGSVAVMGQDDPIIRTDQ